MKGFAPSLLLDVKVILISETIIEVLCETWILSDKGLFEFNKPVELTYAPLFVCIVEAASDGLALEKIPLLLSLAEVDVGGEGKVELKTVVLDNLSLTQFTYGW